MRSVTRSRGRRVTSIPIAIVATVAALVARQVPPAPQAVFRGGVDYVAVDVVVTGSGDKPIADLTAADFEIRENGKPQRIVDFRHVSVPLAHRDLALGQPPAAPPDVVTNAPASPDSRLFVLIVDDLHLVEAVIVPVQRVMTQFINGLSPDDEAAVLFVGRSDLSQNFTRDPARLMKAVANVRAAFGFGIGVYSSEQVEELSYGQSVVWQLKNVAAALGQSGHARRAIVFVGAYSQLDAGAAVGTRERNDARTLQSEMSEAWAAARRADVPIYTLDPRGIPNDGNAISPRNPSVYGRDFALNGNTAHQDPAATADLPAAALAPTTVDRGRATIQQDHLAEIANNTGGRFFINRSDLLGAMDEILTENGSFYVLGYYPDPYVHDGKFHDISVKVTRPGAHVRARPGYVAADAVPGAANVTETLDTAMGAGVNVAGLTLRAFVAPLAAAAKGTSTVVTIEVNYPVPADGSRRIDDDLQVTIVALDPDGKIKASSSRPWHFTGATPATGSVTFLVDDVVDLPAQALTVRVGVASKALGKAGTIQMPIDVPKLSGDKLQLSGVAIGFAGATREAAMGANTLKELVPFQPTTARTFAPADTLRVFARAFWGAKDADASATITVSGAGAGPPRQVALVSTATAGGHRQGTLDATLPLETLAAGDYVLHVDVRLPGGQTARRDVVFAVK